MFKSILVINSVLITIFVIIIFSNRESVRRDHLEGMGSGTGRANPTFANSYTTKLPLRHDPSVKEIAYRVL